GCVPRSRDAHDDALHVADVPAGITPLHRDRRIGVRWELEDGADGGAELGGRANTGERRIVVGVESTWIGGKVQFEAAPEVVENTGDVRARWIEAGWRPLGDSSGSLRGIRARGVTDRRTAVPQIVISFDLQVRSHPRIIRVGIEAFGAGCQAAPAALRL